MHNGKQQQHCHDWGRQCVRGCEPYRIAEAQRTRLERLRLDRLAIRGIGRAVGVQRQWLFGFRGQGVEARPNLLHVQPVTGPGNVMLRRLEVQAEAMASFVRKKANKQWRWTAMDATTRQVMALHVGARSRTSAKRRWAKISEAYRHHATFDTDQDVMYAGGCP
jgi:hypothetical protein